MDKSEKCNRRDALIAMRDELDGKIKKLQEERDRMEELILQCELGEESGAGILLVNKSRKELKGIAYQLKIEWTDGQRDVWRRVVAPAWLTFEHLHRVICHVMDWDPLNLYTFQLDDLDVTFAPPKLKQLLFPGALSAAEYVLDSCLNQANRFQYTYNLKDRKNHQVTVEGKVDTFKGKLPKVLEMTGYTEEDADDDWLRSPRERDPELDLLFRKEDEELWDEGEDYSALLDDEGPYSVEELNADMDLIFDEAYWRD